MNKFEGKGYIALEMACYAIRDNRLDGAFPISSSDLRAAIEAYLKYSELEKAAEQRGYALCQADVVAWHRDRDRQRNAEDVFIVGYQKAKKGMGLGEAVYRGTQAVASAIEAGDHKGAAQELAYREAQEPGVEPE